MRLCSVRHVGICRPVLCWQFQLPGAGIAISEFSLLSLPCLPLCQCCTCVGCALALTVFVPALCWTAKPAQLGMHCWKHTATNSHLGMFPVDRCFFTALRSAFLVSIVPHFLMDSLSGWLVPCVLMDSLSGWCFVRLDLHGSLGVDGFSHSLQDCCGCCLQEPFSCLLVSSSRCFNNACLVCKATS